MIGSLGLLGSGLTIAFNWLGQIMYFFPSFLTPILGQVLGTAIGGSLQTVSPSLSSF